MTMDAQGAPHDSDAAATVGPPQVRLYDPDGQFMIVAADRVDYWLARGMSREPFSIDDAADGLPHLFDEAKRAYAAYVKSIKAATALDTSSDGERATALLAVDLLLQHIGRIEQAADALPVAEGEPVTLMVGDQAIQVDPRQARHYQEQLGAEVAGRTPHEEQANVSRTLLEAEIATAEQAVADGEAALAEHRAMAATTTPGAATRLSSITIELRERELNQWRTKLADLRQQQEGKR
jgi:antitoxin component of MazEF toxin-antitoxin module